MEPQVYEQFSQLEDVHWWFCARRHYISSIVKRLFGTDRQNLTFCEIGAGTGGNLPLLTRFAQVDAVEMNDAARQMIESKSIAGLENLYSGYLPNDMPLLKVYDAVFCLDVVEHVENDVAAVAKLSTYVKDDGYLITTVPAYQWLWSAHDEANHHFRRYTLDSYLELFQNTDLKIVYASYFNTLLFPLAAISRSFQGLSNSASSNSNKSLKLPNRVINFVLLKIFRLEAIIAGRVKMPFGLSIIVVAQKLN